MRVLVMVKANRESEAGALPSTEMLQEMGKFNEELVRAGVMLAAEGLQPSSKGARVYYDAAGKSRIVDGPFAESKELVAGFWLWQVKSWDEALEWARRIPCPMPGSDSNVELRPVFEFEDLGESLTPELREQERRQRAASAALRG